MFEPRALIGAVWAVVFFISGAAVLAIRQRVRVLEYTVLHDRVAVASKDDVFGNIEVKYHGTDVSRLWMTRVILKNDTGKDFEALPIRVYTNDDTYLLAGQGEVAGSIYKVELSPDYLRSLETAQGVTPTPEQFKIFARRRDYVVPVLNRGDKVTWSFLSSVVEAEGRAPIPGPSAWLDVQRAGVRARHRFVGPEVLGVPTKRAILLGLIATVAIYLLAVFTIADPWAAAIPSTIVGFFAPFVGAYIYKAFRFVLPMVVH
jgi:hypothetical protein